jgi:hypothetical protein
VRIILSFLKQEGDQASVATLLERMPGAADYIEAGGASDDGLGGLGSMMGGGAMAVLGKLQGLGLGMGQIQSVATETINFAREKAGVDVVNGIVDSIPGLGQFV